MIPFYHFCSGFVKHAIAYKEMLKNIAEILRNTELHDTYHLYRKGKFIKTQSLYILRSLYLVSLNTVHFSFSCFT